MVPDALSGQPSSEVSSGQRHVYFIQSVEGGPIKIGVSSNVLKRLNELQTGNPHRLRFLLVVAESEGTEAQMHERFGDLRIPGGEWFRPGDALIAFIEQRVLRVCGVV